MHTQSCVRFAHFELDLTTRELRSNGAVHHLQEKPFQVLSILIEQPGQMVSRDELMRRLWPADTFVDFDQSLNKAVNRLREALGDSAEQPLFIETLPRRGYRFIASIYSDSPTPTASEGARFAPAASQPEREAAKLGTRRWIWVLSAGASLALAAIGFRPHRTSAPTPVISQRQLTANPSENAVTSGALSPDGRYLAYADLKGLHVRTLSTGESRDFPEPDIFRNKQVDWSISPNWSNGGSVFIASAMPHGEKPSIWAVSVMSGGAVQRIRDDGMAWAGSRDGEWVIFGSQLGDLYYKDLWVMRPDGTDAHKLFEAAPGNALCGAEFSPDGKRVAYVKWHQLPKDSEISIESRDLQGGPEITAIKIPFDLQDWSWAPDGRIITSFPDPNDSKFQTCNFWATRIDSRSGQPLGPTQQITNWSGFCMDRPSVTSDGKHLAFRRISTESGIYVADLGKPGDQMSVPAPFAVSEGHEILAGWTSDGSAIVFISDRNGKREIFKQARDVGEAERIATNIDEGPGPAETGIRDNMMPRLSPDGRWVLFLARPVATGPLVPTHLMRVSVDGGTPELVLTTSAIKAHSFRCAKELAGLCVIAETVGDNLVFTSFDPQRGRGHELLRFPIESTPDAEYAWDLSPDASRIAIGRRSQAVITVFSLTSGLVHRITGRDWSSLQQLDWARDGKSLLLSAANKAGASLIRVRIDGGEQRLWNFKGSLQASSSPFFGGMTAPRVIESPDGRHLAICSWQLNANMWMLENF